MPTFNESTDENVQGKALYECYCGETIEVPIAKFTCYKITCSRCGRRNDCGG